MKSVILRGVFRNRKATVMAVLNDFKQHIDKLSVTDWNKLFDLIPRIESSGNFGEWKKFEKYKDGVTQFPFVVCTRLVDEFYQLMYELELVVVFDWAKWDAGKEIIETGNYENQDVVTLLKILTTFIRADRFIEGYLIDKFEDGVVKRVLKGLKKNIDIN